MSRHARNSPRRQPDRKIWVFSELNADLNPEDIARLLVRAALEAASPAKAASSGTPAEDADE